VHRISLSLKGCGAFTRDRVGSIASGGAVLALAAVLFVSGCGDFREALRKGNEGIVAAIPIDKSTYDAAAMASSIADPSGATRNIMVGNMLLDGVSKCAIFENGVGTTNRVLDGFFDVTTTALAALGAAFTQASTVRALAAAAAISSGTKTSLEADVFGQKTSPVIVAQINSAYEDGLQKLVSKASLTNLQWPPPVAASEVLFLHEKCSLDAALASLNTELGRNAAQQQVIDKLIQALKTK
jgi:hypothetical protein